MQRASFIWFVAVSNLLFAASSPPGRTRSLDEAERKVNLAFFATDAHGKSVPRLTQSDVEVLDNERSAQRVLGIRARSEVPLVMGMLIDNSDSQSESVLYRAAVHAAAEFSNQVLQRNDDKAFFERFAELPEATQLMSKDQYLALKIDVNPRGRVALYDALRFACEQRMENDSVRDSLRVFVLISDGVDNHSHSNLKQAIASAQRAGVVIFAVDTGDRRFDALTSPFHGNMTLEELAEQTGGKAFTRLSVRRFPEVFTRIREEISNMYLLSYVPSEFNEGRPYHSIQLKPTLKAGLKLRVPKGYYDAATDWTAPSKMEAPVAKP